MNPKVIYSDNVLLVLDKPSGITVNTSDTTAKEQTVQDWVAGQLVSFGFEEGVDSESDFVKRAGIVHRLDKETSGILLVAKTQQAFMHLQAQFKERVVKKSYRALAHGILTPEEGEIRVPVGRLPWNRKRFGVVADGREAVTRYAVQKTYVMQHGKQKEGMSLVELYPETGRTHQIRVHLKYVNHPIVSDFLYAGRKTAREDRKLLERVFLHAAKISFTHPATNEPCTFTSDLPEELQQFIDRYCQPHGA